MRFAHLLFLSASLLLSGCLSLTPPRLTFTPEEQVAIDQIRDPDPQVSAEGRQKLIALHPEWPQDVRNAASAGEILPVRRNVPEDQATMPDPPYADFDRNFLTKGMTRTQVIAAWGFPSERSSHQMMPPLGECWFYRDVSPSIVIWFAADVMRFDPAYPYKDAYRQGTKVLYVPGGNFGFKKQSSIPPD